MKKPTGANVPGGKRGLRDLLGELEDMDYGPVRTSLAERAVGLADALGDTDLAVDARLALVDAGSFGGAQEKALTAFAWVLAHADAQGDRFDQWRTLLWDYKWIADAVQCYPHIERQRIDRILDDMTERYRRYGASLRPVHGLRATWAAARGDREEATRFRAEWNRAPRDTLSDCEACELARDLQHDLDTGNYEVAFERAHPLVIRLIGCTEQPHFTLPQLLVPLVRCGMFDHAAADREILVQLIGRKPGFVGTAGRHMEYLAVIGRSTAAVNQLERWLPEALQTYNLVQRFSYLRGALFVIEELRAAGRKQVSLRLPEPARSPVPAVRDGRYDLAALHAWALAEAVELADRFDARNGSAHFHEVLAGRAELHELAEGLRREEKAAS